MNAAANSTTPTWMEGLIKQFMSLPRVSFIQVVCVGRERQGTDIGIDHDPYGVRLEDVDRQHAFLLVFW